jgi:hypothetical protein
MAKDDFIGEREGPLSDGLIGIDRRAAVHAAELVEVGFHACPRCEARAMLPVMSMKTLGGVIMVAALALGACSKTDDRINDAVKERLAGEPTPLVQLEVTTTDRIVRLNGVVHDEHERARLERIVRDMDDVLGVDNRLTVARPVQTTGERR